jgi:DNA invertase Pin-like site-specific DNA recombinase
MRAAVYSRYSSENQRPESIEDQVSSCRKLAAEKGYAISQNHIYTDVAASGLMLSVLAELRFRGVRVVSVADGLDSEDEEATVSIQVRGIFNELQLQDLRVTER